MESDEVATGGELVCVPPTVLEQTAVEKPKVAIDSIEFRNLATEEDVCRICQDRGSTSQPLLHHCACKGSLGFVHEVCLRLWLDVSRERRCEICKQDYPFSLPDPDLYPGGFEYSLDFRYWLVPTIVVIWNHVLIVRASAIPSRHTRIMFEVWGSVIYLLLCSGAYLIWRYYILHVHVFTVHSVIYDDQLVGELREGREYIREAIFDYVVPYDVLRLNGLCDFGAMAFDYMLPVNLFNIAIDIGAAAYTYLFSSCLYFLGLFSLEMYCGGMPGDAHAALTQGDDFLYPPHRRSWKAILAIFYACTAETACWIAMSELYRFAFQIRARRCI